MGRSQAAQGVFHRELTITQSRQSFLLFGSLQSISISVQFCFHLLYAIP